MAKQVESTNINSVSRISEGTVCKGEIYSMYDVRIDGVLEGKIYTQGRIVIGESASVSGEIICNNIDLWGKMSGKVYVKDTLNMKAGCKVAGEINVHRFMAELGSEFNGSCKMISEAEYDKLAAEEDKKL